MKTKLTYQEKRALEIEEYNRNCPYQSSKFFIYNIHDAKSVVNFFKVSFQWGKFTPQDGEAYIIFMRFYNDVIDFKIESLSVADVLAIRTLKTLFDEGNK